MDSRIKKIGVLTSGGDSQGMNAAIRAVTRHALSKGVEVCGIYEGYNGLIKGGDYIRKFDTLAVNNIINRGGTILYSARCDEFKTDEGLNAARENCIKNGIDGLIVIGGDGTFRGASDLCVRGIPCVGIPATIDNDIACTDRTIGYDTALNITMQCIDNLRDTDESLSRCNVIEVMGRGAGYIAVEAGIACGATGIVCNEDSNYCEEDLINRINIRREHGKRNIMVVVSEGVSGYSEELARTIEKKTGVETKFARLAHIVRGGSPTAADRVLASRMGSDAVDLLLGGQQNVFVCVRYGSICPVDIQFAVTNDKLYKSSYDPTVKYPEEALKKFSYAQVAEMKMLCDLRAKEFRHLIDISNGIIRI